MIERLKNLLRGQPEEEADPVERERMVKASGVTYARLVCTPETWSKLSDMCTPGGGGVLSLNMEPRSALGTCPTQQTEGGLLEATLTGPELSEVLFWTGGGRSNPLAEGALATRIYDEISRNVDRIDLEAKDGKQLEPIVIDARLGTN